MVSPTRAQLAALTDLHEHGYYPGVPGARHHRETLEALVVAGLARWDLDTPVYARPVLHTWADGSGCWHVALPTRTAEGASPARARAIARAAIWGEIRARHDGDAAPAVRLSRVGSDVYVYREA